MRRGLKLARREGIIFICFVVFGIVALPFFFVESSQGYLRALFTESGIDLIVTWIAVLGPYLGYLVIRSIVWLIQSIGQFRRTVADIVKVRHQPKALAR